MKLLEERRTTSDTIRDGWSLRGPMRRRAGRHVVAVSVLCVLCGAISLACGGDDPKKTLDLGGGSGANPNSGNQPQGGQDKEKEITTEGQALKVLLAFSSSQIDEARAGGGRTKSPEVRTLAEGLVTDYTAREEALRTLGEEKGIRSQGSGLAERVRFMSESSINHIKNVMPDMVDNAYVTRVLNAHKELITQIDEAIMPIVEDEDLKAQVAEMRDDATRHMADAEQVAEAVKGEAPPVPPVGPVGPPDGGLGEPGPMPVEPGGGPAGGEEPFGGELPPPAGADAGAF